MCTCQGTLAPLQRVVNEFEHAEHTFIFVSSVLAYSRCSINFVKADKLLADQLLPKGEKGVCGGGGERRFTKLDGN